MSRMQRTGQRPCADVSALRRASHRHHQTTAEGGAHRFWCPVGFRSHLCHHYLDYLSSIHGQGNGPAKSDAATAAIALIFQTDCAKT